MHSTLSEVRRARVGGNPHAKRASLGTTMAWALSDRTHEKMLLRLMEADWRSGLSDVRRRPIRHIRRTTPRAGTTIRLLSDLAKRRLAHCLAVSACGACASSL